MQAANEEALWKYFPTGTELDLSDAPDPSVRADVIRKLLCGGQEGEPGHVAAVRLRGAEIVGQLDLDGADFSPQLALTDCSLPQGATFVEARTRSLYFDGCRINGLVLFSALVDGRVSLQHAHLTTPNEVTLLGDSMGIEDDLRCDYAYFDGTVSLICARVSKHSIFSGVHISASNDIALKGYGANIGKTLFFDEQFEAAGAIGIVNATIGSELIFTEATLRNLNAVALRLDGTAIAHNAWLDNGFHAVGEVSMAGTQIGQDLNLDGAYIFNPTRTALNAHSVNIGKNLGFVNFSARGDVCLIEATTTQLDDKNATYTEGINLNGFTYTTLFPHSGTKERLAWLDKHHDFRAQPYEHLAQVYRSRGEEVHARSVLQAKERAITRRSSWWRRGPRHILDWLVGYGHFPARALWWVLGALAIGSVVFAFFPPAAAPSKPSTGQAPSFNSVLYTLDVLLPAPKLGVEKHWNPTGGGLALSVALKLAGWVLSIAAVASLTRLLSRK